jgi:hypothetical protein
MNRFDPVSGKSNWQRGTHRCQSNNRISVQLLKKGNPVEAKYMTKWNELSLGQNQHFNAIHGSKKRLTDVTFLLK